MSTIAKLVESNRKPSMARAARRPPAPRAAHRIDHDAIRGTPLGDDAVGDAVAEDAMERRGGSVAQVDDAVSHHVRVLDIGDVHIGAVRKGEQRADDVEQLRVARGDGVRLVAPLLVGIEPAFARVLGSRRLARSVLTRRSSNTWTESPDTRSRR